jgi:transposase
MAQRRLSVRKTKEILRLKAEARLGNHKIARALGISAATVWEALMRAEAAGLTWPLPEGMTEGELERRLYPSASTAARKNAYVPDWSEIGWELRKKHVTLRLLWEEYKILHPDGYEYSWFCQHFRGYQKTIDLVMRQEHKLGERAFIDWAGDTIPVIDTETGEVRPCYLFLAVLGASNYTFAEPTLSQDLAAFLALHVHMFEFFGGVPELLVPDNLKTGVTSPSYYEPDLNPAYTALAEHYGCCVLPTRPGRPRDKAKVEAGVLFAERRIMAVLRHRRFFSLEEVRAAVAIELDRLNDRVFQKLPGSRKSVFTTEEQPVLRPLPDRPYEHRDRKRARVHIDYHVELFGHYYSVPYRLTREEVEIRYTTTLVEIFHQGVRVASHPRSDTRGRATTEVEHMPAKHRHYLEWTPERFESWAKKIGPETERLVLAVMARYRHPALGYRSCLGILRLEQRYGAARLEAAAERTLSFGGASYKSVSHILQSGLDQKPGAGRLPAPEPLFHANLRGPDYFSS